jgi:hypothetical protein
MQELLSGFHHTGKFHKKEIDMKIQLYVPNNRTTLVQLNLTIWFKSI